MSVKRDWLLFKVLDFVVILRQCFSDTTYTQDRPLYANDITAAATWLVRLHQGVPPEDVAQEIVDSATTKQFTDYWRQGTWGDLEAEALNSLQEEVRKKFEL